MNICVVCARLSFGGAERVAVLWANGLGDVGHQVMIISNLYDPITYNINEGIMVRNLVAGNSNKLKKWGSSFFQVRKAVKEFRPDVIIGVMPTCSFVSKVASLGLRVPIIATEHNSFDMEPFKKMSTIEIFCKFYLNRIYSHVTVLTEEDKQMIGNRLKHVSVMPNPLALHPIIVSDEKLSCRERVFLAAGRLDAWYVKGFDVLIRAWGHVNGKMKIDNGELNPSCDGWKLQIAGTGSEESLNYLKQLCKENGVEDSVEFLGFRKDVEKLYQNSSIFVLSSRYEGFGLVLIEAMSQGCACIACDYKGRQREIVQNDMQGICCEPENVEALADAMTRMITDSEYRESVRSQAVERSKAYKIDCIIEKWESLLKQIVGN